MSVFLANLADKMLSKLTSDSKKDFNQEQGALLYHANGSVSLNLSNKEVQKKITKHLEELAQFKIEKHGRDKAQKKAQV